MKATWKYFVSCCCILCLQTAWGLANGATVGVVYPELREPYSKIFDTIMDGIEQQMGEKIDRYGVAKQYDIEVLDKKIRNRGNKLLVALGGRGVKVVEQLPNNPLPVVVGAVLPSSVTPNPMGRSGISLVPDPQLLFMKLKSFVPGIKTVSVVYNPDNNRFLIETAIQSGNDLGILVDARAANDLRDAALIYRELLETIDHKTNAIWLIQDASTLDSNVILPLILQQAWNRDLVVFSNNLVLAKRGALFSMYPDNLNMGKELAKLAQSILSNSNALGIRVLRALKIAVNIRTAKHLNINFTLQQEKSFDLVFPRQ